MPNPFNRAQLSVLDARVPVERLHVCLTTVMQRICALEGGPAAAQEVSRTGFAIDLRAAAIEVHRLAGEASDASAVLATALEELALRVESGEDLSRFDVTVPWERPRPRRGEVPSGPRVLGSSSS